MRANEQPLARFWAVALISLFSLPPIRQMALPSLAMLTPIVHISTHSKSIKTS